MRWASWLLFPCLRWWRAKAPQMTPSRAEVVTFCAATLVIVVGAVGLLMYSGRGPILLGWVD
jgi:hypothetical protein